MTNCYNESNGIKTPLILFFFLLLTVFYLTPVQAVTDAELEVLEKKVEQQIVSGILIVLQTELSVRLARFGSKFIGKSIIVVTIHNQSKYNYQHQYE